MGLKILYLDVTLGYVIDAYNFCVFFSFALGVYVF